MERTCQKCGGRYRLADVGEPQYTVAYYEGICGQCASGVVIPPRDLRVTVDGLHELYKLDLCVNPDTIHVANRRYHV